METETDTDSPAARVICPWCGGTECELASLFGQQLLTVQYYCTTCHTPFEHVKDTDVIETAGVAHTATCL